MNLSPQRGTVHSKFTGCFHPVTLVALQGFTDHRFDGSIPVSLWPSVSVLSKAGNSFREMVQIDLLPPAEHNRVFNGISCEFIEKDSVNLFVRGLEFFGNVPSNGLSLSVRVRGQIDVVCLLGGLLYIADELLFAFDYRIVWRKFMLNIAFGQSKYGCDPACNGWPEVFGPVF